MPRKSKPKVKAKPLPKLKSGYEKKIAKFLRDRDIKAEYEKGKIPYTVPEKKKNYIPDFLLPNGIYVEGKGLFNRVGREKMLLVVQQNPELDIRMLFMRDNTISKTSKTRYSDWCEKNGIKYAISEYGEIPEEWLL